MKKCYLFAFVFLLCGYANATSMNEEVIERRSRVAKKYNQLKRKADDSEKVRVIVKFKNPDGSNLKGMETASRKQALDFGRRKLASEGITAIKTLKYSNAAVYEIDSQQLDQIIDGGLVEVLQEDEEHFPVLSESISHIGGDLSHDYGYTGNGQAIVVIDTGVDSNHPFFEGRVVEEACFSTSQEDDYLYSLCPNGQEQQIGLGAGNNCSQEIAGCDHGTHVAGIAAGANQDMKGVAIQASIISVQVFTEIKNYFSCNGEERCSRLVAYTSDILEALEWVLHDANTKNISAINLSLGGGLYSDYCDDNILKETIDQLREVGIATVIASGNNYSSTKVSHPGCINSAITVGSTLDSMDIISDFSNSAYMVDILAPGEAISSSIIDGLYSEKSGTSMATPHVTGAIAVLKSINPNASIDDIEQSLKDNGVNVLDTRNNQTFPRLDLFTSVKSFNVDYIPIDVGGIQIIIPKAKLVQ